MLDATLFCGGWLFDLYERGLYEEAGRGVLGVLSRDEGCAEAWLVDGLLRARRGEKIQAERSMQRAEALLPELAEQFDFRTPLLVQRGLATWISIRATRFRQVVRFAKTSGFVVSYPKCGRTWLRLLIGRALGPACGGLDDKNVLETAEWTEGLGNQPVVDFTNDDYPAFKPWHTIETGEMGDRAKRRYAGKRVLLLVRDPRDVMVSYYFQYTRRGDREWARDSFSGSLSDFLRHPIGGLRSLLTFWEAWNRAQSIPASFSVLRYEDLHRDPLSALRNVLGFFGLKPESEDAVACAVQHSRFEVMHDLERRDALGSFRLRPGDVNDPESYKTRRGIVGGYRDYLSANDLAWMNEQLAALPTLLADYRTERPASE